ncbi:TPA: hypothetical protein ACGO0F_000661 [Streptococcus suis]
MKKCTHYSIRKTKWDVASLVLSTSLLLSVSNIATVLADTASLTQDEQAKVDAFLTTKPIHGAQTSLGQVNLPLTSPPPYVFPGIDSYTSFFLTGEKSGLPVNVPFSVNPYGGGRLAAFKDFDSVEAYRFAVPSGEEPSKHYLVKKATIQYLDDYSEEAVENVVVYFTKDYAGRDVMTYYGSNNFEFDIPVEANDPRFSTYTAHSDAVGWAISEGGGIGGSHWGTHQGGYWGLSIPITEDIPYESIVTIDENLKTGEIIEDVAGNLGRANVGFGIVYNYRSDTATVNASNYKQFTSDRIYDDVMETYGDKIVQIASENLQMPYYTVGNFTAATYEWGTVNLHTSLITPSQNRQLRVGIDYTNFIKKDGTELAPKEYGLQESKTFSGYTLAETRAEANGDRTFVYREASTSTSSSGSTSSSTSGSTSTSTSTSTLTSTSSSTSMSAPILSSINTSKSTILPNQDAVPSSRRSRVLPSTGVVGSVGLAVLGLGILAGTLTWRDKGKKRSK